MKIFISQPINGRTRNELYAEQETIKNAVGNKFYKDTIEIVNSLLKNYDPHTTAQEFLKNANVAIFVDGWELDCECIAEYKYTKSCNINILHAVPVKISEFPVGWSLETPNAHPNKTQLQEEFKMGKHINRETEAMWNDESVPTYKSEALRAAIDLGYDDQCLKDIHAADTIPEISRAMINGRHRLERQEEETSAKSKYKTKPAKEKEFVPALFGVNADHTDKYYHSCVHLKSEYEDERQQLDILQEECAELIKAVSKVNRLREFTRRKASYKTNETLINDWYEARANLVEEMAHVAISSAIVSRILGVSQDEIDTEVKRKDELLPKTGVDLANGPDMTSY